MKTLPKRNPNLPAEQQGMFHKYDVRRVYSDREVPGKHIGCQYFVLDETHDPFARPALQAYAMACQATHPKLAEELFSQWGVPASMDKPAPALTEPYPAIPGAPTPSAMGIDATKWSAAFCQLNSATDMGTMMGWFANSILAGFDEGQRRATAARSVPDGDSIAGAVARGWCAPENSAKVMDEELVWAIVGEVQKVLVAGLGNLEAPAPAPASKLNELSAVGLLQSLWNDTGLRQLMRPDQVRRLGHVLGKEQAQ